MNSVKFNLIIDRERMPLILLCLLQLKIPIIAIMSLRLINPLSQTDLPASIPRENHNEEDVRPYPLCFPYILGRHE